MKKFLIMATFVAMLAGCGEETNTNPPPQPPPPPVVQAPAPAPPPTVVEEAAPSTYVVVKGDTLYSIARDHNVRLGDLAEWNHISNANLIHVGQEIKLAAPDK